MDAKPQRPLRAAPIPGLGAENVVAIKQPIHQRHKSVGNLKTMTATGGLNLGPKRTAFVDLSNTSRALVDLGPKGQVKDRVTILNNRETLTTDKENLPFSGNEAFRRPAQRPIGHYTSKPILPISISSTTAFPAAKSSTFTHTNTHPEPRLPPITKAGGSKKATVIFDDQKNTRAGAKLDIPVPAHQSDAMEKQSIKHLRHYQSQPQLRLDQPVVLRRTQSRLLGKSEELDKYDDKYDDNATEATYEDALEALPEQVEQAPQTADARSVRSARSVSDDMPEIEDEPVMSVAPSVAGSTGLPALPPHGEPEEYWDEDDEGEELDDEQGYTTAHSYRSHGDNTTGGATTMVAPKITSHVQEELEMARSLVESIRTEDDIEEEAWDVSMVAEYGEEIFAYMKTLEAKMLPNPHYMDIQTEIQWSMRSILMEWLVQVHSRFGLLPETLFLAVNYIDRFLSVKVVSLGKLQLVGATAIFVAAKYEEINCPSVQEIEYMVNNGYSGDEILKAERFMLSMLQFELGWPGPMSFLRRISKADDYDLETRTLAKYFLEVTVLDERFVGSPPSFLAAGAHCLARLMLRKGEWSLAHVHYSGYTLGQLKQVVATIFECCLTPRKHHAAVFHKYANAKYKRASTFVESEVSRGYILPFPSAPSQPSRFPDNSLSSANYEAYTTGFPIPAEEAVEESG